MKPDPALDVEVFEGVYAPSDDTFLLLDAVGGVSQLRVLEMGAGTGLIAVHCAKAGASVTAADVSEKAVANARHNAEKNGVSITVIQSDLFSKIEGAFDLILFNPPYLSGRASEALEGDDERQLVGGEEGHEVTARFLDGASNHLAEDGRILLLVSSESAKGVLGVARAFYDDEKVLAKRTFFEELAVYSLMPKSR